MENLADEPRQDDFPDAFGKLTAFEMKQNGNEDHSIYQCPKCGYMYEYMVSMPGGSYDAMRTWIVERLTPMMKNGKHLRKNIPPKPKQYEEVHEFVCPACRSYDVDCDQAGIIGGEVFLSLKCNKCGNEDTVDEYQLIAWRS